VFVELGGIAMGLRLVHDASLEEIRERFGQFHGSDRRVQLFAVLEKFAADAKSAALVQAMIVNGSFTTDKVRLRTST